MDPRTCIAASPLLGQLPSAAIDELTSEAVSVSIRGGDVLFEAGDRTDAVYIIAVGRLRIDIPAKPVDVAAGEIVGEVGVLTDEPRMARAYALRDTLLIKIDAEPFRRILARHEDAQRALLRMVVNRLRGQSSGRDQHIRSAHAVAVLPLTEDADYAAVARALAHALSAVLGGHVPLLDRHAVDRDLGTGAAQTRFDAGAANTRIVSWLQALEADAVHLVATADGMPDPWTLRVARQADRVLLVSGDGPINTDTLQALETSATPAPRELVHCGKKARARELLQQSGAGFLHHCALHAPATMKRLARQVAGKATGLVLGGGGARGFAHIGLLRALQEAELDIDMIGGTSMGAFIAALHAQGISPADMRDICDDVFVQNNHLNDWVIPRVSLIRGRKFLNKLRSVLGDGLIEDLPIPFYCVSTNLTRGQPQVHREGKLASWVGTSMCVPGIAPPVVYQGDLLADGAVVNSVPVDTMHLMDRGPVIACDVGAPGELCLRGVKGPAPEALLKARRRKRPQLSDILMRMTTMTSDLRLEENARHADLFLRMPVASVSMFGWDALDDIIETGYAHACEALEDALRDWPGEDGPPDFHAPLRATAKA